VISIIGPGMTIVGNIETDGTVRIEGSVDGSITAGKAVVIGKNGEVVGDISTQDAVISGRVEGTLRAASRLELQATCHIEGEVHTRRMQLEEGAVLNGNVHMGENVQMSDPAEPKASASEGSASKGSTSKAPASKITSGVAGSTSTSGSADSAEPDAAGTDSAKADDRAGSAARTASKSDTKSDTKTASKAETRETATTGT
jgi:cytoskeletal protein CcmA (bactofilin family)